MIRLTLTVLVTAIGLWLLNSGCVSTRRAVSILEQKKVLSNVCAERFPIRDSVIIQHRFTTDTIYFVSDSIRFRDTVLCNRDTLFLSHTVTVPRLVFVRDTVFRDSIVFRENTAKLAALQAEAANCETEKAHIKGTLSVWRGLALVAIAAMVLGVILVGYLKA